MNPHKEWFSTYTTYDGGDFFFRDNSIKNNFFGKWRVQLCFNDGRIKIINYFLHILGLHISLLFVSKLHYVW